MGQWVAVCCLDEIPDGEARGFDPEKRGRDTVFVIRLADSLVAYRDVCPHYGTTSLPWRKNAYLDAAGTEIICAAHGARFEIATGLCLAGPCLGESLTSVPVRTGDKGQVLIELDRDNKIGDE